MAAGAAADLPTWWQVVGPVVGALVALVTGVATYRAAQASNRVAADRLSHDRDAAIDARSDELLRAAWDRLSALSGELDRRTRELWQVAERHQRLRLAVLAMGYDPDALIEQSGGSGE